MRHWWNFVFVSILVLGTSAWLRYGLDGRIVFGALLAWLGVGKAAAPSIIHEHMGFLNRWVFHDYNKASFRYRQAVATNKATPEAYGALASLSFAEGEYGEAASLLEQAVKQRPEDPYLRFLLSKTMLRQGRALDALDAAVCGTSMPHPEAVAYAILGDAQLASGDRNAAAGAYERALELEPGFTDCRLNFADIHVSNGDLSAADKQVGFVLETDPQNPDGFYWAARVALLRGERKRASTYLQGSLNLRSPSDHSRLVPYETVVSELAQVRRDIQNDARGSC